MIKSYYYHPKDTWDVVHHYIENAQKNIYIEQFFFKRDKLGNPILKKLEEKAKQGIEVKILVDAFSGRDFTFYQSPSKNLEVQMFRPVWKGGWTIYPRTHRKIVAIDGEVGFYGGNCIDQTMLEWRDTMLETTGEMAKMAEKSFLASWQAGSQKSAESVTFKHSTKDMTVYNSFGYKQDRIYHETLREKVLGATEFIYLTSPYLILDDGFKPLLIKRAQEGIDVKIMMSGHSKKINRLLQQNFYQGLINAGIKLYYYKNVMMHTKTAIIDNWAAIGSSNLDQLSFHKNREINLAGAEQELYSPLKKHFLDDLHHTVSIDQTYMDNRKWWEVLASKVLYPLKEFF